MTETDLSRVVASIYEAAVDVRGWDRAMRTVSGAMRVPFAAILRQDIGAPRRIVMAGVHNVDPLAQQLYNAYYGARDPWAMALRDTFSNAPGRPIIATSEQLVPERAFQRTEYYNDFGRAHTSVGHACMVTPDDSHTSFVALTLPRGAGSAPYSTALLRPLRLIVPHIRLATRVHDLCERSADTESVEQVLDSKDDAVFVLDADARLRWANRAGHAMLESGAHLCLRHGRVEPRATDALSTFRRQVASTRIAPNTATPIRLRTATGSLKLWTAPLTGGGDAHTGSATGPTPRYSVLLVATRRTSPTALTELFREVYGLTPLEGRIAALLATRGTPASGDMPVVGPRLRWHLKQLYRKTGTTHQADLVSRLGALAVAWRPPHRSTTL